MKQMFVSGFLAAIFGLTALIGFWAPIWLVGWLLISMAASLVLASKRWQFESWSRKATFQICAERDSLSRLSGREWRKDKVVGRAPCGPTGAWIAVLVEKPNGRRTWMWLNPEEAADPADLRRQINAHWAPFPGPAVLMWGGKDEALCPAPPLQTWLWTYGFGVMAGLLAAAALLTGIAWLWTPAALAGSLAWARAAGILVNGFTGPGIRLGESGFERMGESRKFLKALVPANAQVKGAGSEARLVWIAEGKRHILPVWAPFAPEFWPQ